MRYPSLRKPDANEDRVDPGMLLSAASHALQLCGGFPQDADLGADAGAGGVAGDAIELRLEHAQGAQMAQYALRLIRYALELAEAKHDAKQASKRGAASNGDDTDSSDSHGDLSGEELAAADAARAGCIDALCACMRYHQSNSVLVQDLMH